MTGTDHPRTTLAAEMEAAFVAYAAKLNGRLSDGAKTLNLRTYWLYLYFPTISWKYLRSRWHCRHVCRAGAS